MATAGRGKRGSSSFEALVTVEPDHFCVFPKHTHAHKTIKQTQGYCPVYCRRTGPYLPPLLFEPE